MSAMTSPLAEQVAIVTGGSSGIGRATCEALAAAGARVGVVGRDTARIDTVVGGLAGRSAGQDSHFGLALDVRREDHMSAMVERTLHRFGRIDILITCAAILRPPGSAPKLLAETSLDEWRLVLETNLYGVVNSNRAVAKIMTARGAGTIVNVSSVSGIKGRAHDAPYCASKFAVVGLSQSLAAEVGRHGVRVCVIHPDATETPIWEQNRPVPMPRNAIPASRVAETIVRTLMLPGDAAMPSVVVAPLQDRHRLGAEPSRQTA